MFKILVAVDGSESSRRALAQVVTMCASMHASEVHLINVQPEPIVYGEVAVYLSEDKARQMARDAGEAIVDDAARTLRESGISATAAVVLGDAAPSIVDHAAKIGCSLIVMGTRGMSAIGNMIMGSVANKVVHLTKTSVMLVH